MTAHPPSTGAAGEDSGRVRELSERGGGDFVARGLIRWTRYFAARRVSLTVILVLQAAIFSAFSAWIAWQPDVLQFFSADSAEVQSVHQAVEKSGLVNQLHFDVHFSGEVEPQVFTGAVQELAAALFGTRQFHTVWSGVDPNQVAASYQNLAAQAPLLLDQPSLLESRISAEYLNKRFLEVRHHLGDPDGEILLRQLAADPLNVADFLAPRLRNLAPSEMDSSVSFQDGLLTAHDQEGRRHAMIVAEPNSLPSDQKAAGATLDATYSAIKRVELAHPGLAVWVVGPHRGYVENARLIKADVTRISFMGMLAVLLAIAFYFRRVTTALLCLIPPTVGVGLALGLAGIAHVTLPLILLGFAGLLCGSTTDYGILIIAECGRLFAENQNRWHVDFPAMAVRGTLAPISMSVATSVTGFAALAFSASPGLRALGLFVAGATVCIWLVTFLVLPAYLGPWVLPKFGSDMPAVQKNTARGAKVKTVFLAAGCMLFVALTLYFSGIALHVRFNANPRSLDGSSTRADEEAFAAVWGDLRNRGIVLVTKPSADEALLANRQVHNYLEDQQRDGLIASFTSAAPLLPDQATLQTRNHAWNAFLTPARRAQLRDLLAAAATSNQFKPEVFAAYADHVASLEIVSASERIVSSPAFLLPGLIAVTPTSTTVATLVQMRSDISLRAATAWGPELRIRYPGVTILSGNILFFDATDRAREEGQRLAPWCILAILLPLLVYFCCVRRAWLVLTCLLVGFIWVLAGAMLLGGGGLNLLSLVPILFTLGVAVDYGIYASTAPATAGNVSSRLRATFLCALTTILGAGSLAFAFHPALRWLGITLVAGITGGYLTSLFVVAPLAGYLRNRRENKRAGVSRWLRIAGHGALTLLLLGITGLLVIPPVTEFALARQRPAKMPAAMPLPELQQIAPRFFRAGDSWMRYHPATGGDSGVWEIALIGNPSERGRAVAQLAAPIDYRIETEMLNQLDTLLPNEFSRFLITRAFAANLIALPRYIPEEYQEEIYASATALPDPRAYLAPTYPRILSYHALHDISQMLIDNPLVVPNTFACTGVVSLPAYSAQHGGHLLLARNFDFEGGESFGKQKSITYVIPPPGEGIPFAHVAWPGLAGCVTGINQQKIALFLNAAATSDFRRVGTPTILMAREILEHADSLDAAEKIIRRTQTFVSDIITIADGKTGQARIFEKSPGHVGVLNVTESAVVTNHLVTPVFADDPVNRARQEDGTTLQRYVRARQLLDRMHENVSPSGLAVLLRDKKAVDDKSLGWGNRNAVDGLIACHSVVMDVTTGQLWVAAWPNAEGEFIGVDVMAMLDRTNGVAGNPDRFGSASPPTLPSDTMMSDGSWQRFVASRAAARQAEAAFQARNFAAALQLAREVIHDNPEFYLGHELAGRALMMKGEPSAAKLELEEALDHDPPYAKIRTAIKGLIQQCETH